MFPTAAARIIYSVFKMLNMDALGIYGLGNPYINFISGLGFVYCHIADYLPRQAT